ncbi:MAG: hypothetical protein LBG20_04005 [Holosporaceae bacterium]|nr:hypothetical protein [Holosporaceae bacterium]
MRIRDPSTGVTQKLPEGRWFRKEPILHPVSGIVAIEVVLTLSSPVFSSLFSSGRGELE